MFDHVFDLLRGVSTVPMVVSGCIGALFSITRQQLEQIGHGLSSGIKRYQALCCSVSIRRVWLPVAVRHTVPPSLDAVRSGV